MAELKLSGTSIVSDASGTPTLNAGVTLNSTFPAGHTIQMVQSVKQNAFSTAQQAEILVTDYRGIIWQN